MGDPLRKVRSGSWEAIAVRAIESLGVRPGEVIELREHSGRYDVVQEMVLAIEQRGATPRVEVLPPELFHRLLTSVDPSTLADRDHHRAGWMEDTDRVLVLMGADPDLDVAPNALNAWSQATNRLVQIEERRRLPYLLIAIPTEARALAYNLTLEQLEAIVLPALAATRDELEVEVGRIRPVLDDARSLVIQTGDNRLEIDITGRRWMQDTGEIPPRDERGEVQPVLNFPAGSVYTTVKESATTGTLRLPRAGDATDVTLHFANGSIASIEAESGEDDLAAMFDRHTGEPRRVSHIGVGLNPHLRDTIGWPLVDEHRHGSLFIAFGENRYLGGENESSLNVDFVIPDGTLIAGGQTVVDGGKLAV